MGGREPQAVEGAKWGGLRKGTGMIVHLEFWMRATLTCCGPITSSI